MHPIVGSPPPLQCPAVLSVHHCGHPLPLDVWKLHQVMAEGKQKWLRRSQKSQMHCFKMKASHAETVKIRKKNLEKDPNRHSKLFEWNTSNHAVGWKTLERSQNLWFQNNISSGFVLFSSFRKLVMDMWWSATRNVQPVQPTGSCMYYNWYYKWYNSNCHIQLVLQFSHMLGLEYHPDTVVALQWLLYVKSCKHCLQQASINCMYSTDIPVQHLIPKMESRCTLSPNLPN